MCMRVRVLHLYLNYTICMYICLRSSVNDNTCLLGDAILRIPRVSPRLSDTRDMRVSTHIARGIRMMASFRRLKKGSHPSTPVYLAQWSQPLTLLVETFSVGLVETCFNYPIATLYAIIYFGIDHTN